MQQAKDKQVDLSIIILTYNSRDVVLGAIASIEKHYKEEVKNGQIELIVVDNGSTDDSYHVLETYSKKTTIKSFRIIDNKRNIGFSAGNNKAIPYTKGRYILFLNPDTVVYPQTLTRMIAFMDSHPQAGAATCKVLTPQGTVDQASHRGFPTPWNAFTHFTGLEKLFPQSKWFAGYTRGWEDFTKLHTIPACVGAFLFVRRSTGEKIGWWDEDYFFYGEDLQFCYDIGKAGYKIYYVPDVHILHYGGVSSGIKKHTQHMTTADTQTRIQVQHARFDAMRTFYKKNYSRHHPIIAWVVMKGINLLHKKHVYDII